MPFTHQQRRCSLKAPTSCWAQAHHNAHRLWCAVILRKYSTFHGIHIRLSDSVIHRFFTRHQRRPYCVRLLCRTGARQAAMTHYRGESVQARGFHQTLAQSLTQNQQGKRTMLSAWPQRGSWRELGDGTEVASHRASHREARPQLATGVGSRLFNRLRGLSGAHEVTVPGWSPRGGNRAAR